MLRDLIDQYYFEGNYNCAETILHAANDFYGLELGEREMRLVSGFGGGMQSGNTCGALLGGISVLSLLYVRTKGHESNDIKPVTNLFLEEFRKNLNDSILCSEIKPAFFREGTRCLQTVQAACDALEKVVLEYVRLD